MNKKHMFACAAFAAVVLAAILFAPRKGTPEALDSFAKCIAEKKITMYGAAWCPHCQNEKAAFGDSFRFVPYVECPKEPQRCIAARIEGYPTWVFSDPPATTSSGDVGQGGRRLVGEQGIQKLSEVSGCPLPAAQ